MTEVKKLKTTENVIEEEEEVSPQVYFGTASPFAQSVVLCHIFENNFNLFEQIKMRRVCRLWHYNVKHIWNKEQSLVLTVKDESIKPSLSPELNKPMQSLESNQFYTLQMVKGFKLTIGKNHWNQATIDLLGNLFRNIEHLTIFYELSCEFHTTDNLCYFLQKFNRVKSFSLIMPPDGTVREDFLFRLFKIINDHLAPLHTLQIYLPDYIYPFLVVKKELFHKTLPFVQNFLLNCKVKNLGQILKYMGTFLPAHFPIQSLSINISDEKSLSSVETLFKRNPMLTQIKRLELTGLGVVSLNIVSGILDHFKELECLNLCRSRFEGVFPVFTNDWIKILRKLPRLNEFCLCNFIIKFPGNLSIISFPNIRKLTFIASYGFSTNIKHQFYFENQIMLADDVEPRLVHQRFLSCFAKQYPKLEQLTIRQTYDNFDKNFNEYCFAEFRNLKTLKLIGEDDNLLFTS